MAEAVDALVRDEGVGAHAVVLADRARDVAHLRLRGRVRERALQDPVVVARPAARRALRERLRDVAVVPRERRRADHVHDAVAVRLDALVGLHLLVEEDERRLRAVLVGEVAEGLLDAALVALAVLELRVVGLELAGRGMELVGRAGADGAGVVLPAPPPQPATDRASAGTASRTTSAERPRRTTRK